MDRAMGRFGVHAIAEESEVLHFLTNETAGEADLLASDRHHFLPIKQLLSYNGRQSPQHVVARVHHHSLRTDS